MPLYYFNLKDVDDTYIDCYGTELRDEAQALEHARQVAWELMHRREVRSRSWRLQVCDNNRNIMSELLFASVDRTVRDLPPALRDTVEMASARTAALSDVIADVRVSLHQLKGTLARSRGVPYLAALNGRPLEPQ